MSWNNWNYNFRYPPQTYPNNWADQSYGYNDGRSYQPQRDLVAGRVVGKNGALNIQMNPNMAGLFLDETAPILWIKSTDSTGRAVLNGYNLSPISEETTVDENTNLYDDKINAVLNKIDAIERRIDELNISKSGAPAVKPKQRSVNNVQYGAGKGNLSDNKEL